jgi:F0F1-type ATP synthase assembly protein I
MKTKIKGNKTTIAELHNKIEYANKTANEYKAQLKDVMNRKPVQTAAVLFLAGLVSGVIVGAVKSRHS